MSWNKCGFKSNLYENWFVNTYQGIIMRPKKLIHYRTFEFARKIIQGSNDLVVPWCALVNHISIDTNESTAFINIRFYVFPALIYVKVGILF